ncbi:MAG TPA: hypothetical protein PLX79_04475 [Candidatus Dojkabacteria bacterium]|nr:hypothetical protein [Candidatus Dojkabacteria bacterium]
MTTIEELEQFVKDIFKTTLEIFIKALKLSPNAQGYVSGSISELLLKDKLEGLKFEVKRIREKWEGRKLPHHHGDFYFRKGPNDPWYVLESKGLKSNSEKWHKLYNHDNLVKILFDNYEKISWIDKSNEIEPQITAWIDRNLPKFKSDYKSVLYNYEEIHNYIRKKHKKETQKLKNISLLEKYSRDQINEMIDNRLDYVMSKVKVLETHFVSGTTGQSRRSQATPRKDEFNLISIDLFLRINEHKFVFANPKRLESSADDPNHLQQNYIMGFVFTDENGETTLNLSNEWYDDFEDVYKTLNPEDAINENEMQIDNRNLIVDK